MKILKSIFVATLLFLCNSASAQYEDGYYYNQSYNSYQSRSYDYYDYDSWGDFFLEYSPMKLVTNKSGYDDLNFNGFTVGFKYAFRFGYSPVFMDAGFETTGAYFSESYTEDHEKVKHNIDLYFSKIPINLGFRFDIGEAFAIVPYGGVHLTINISGKEREKTSHGEYRWNLFDEDDMNDCAYNRFQVGYQGGLKFIIFNTLSIGASYKGDFTPIYSEDGVKQKFRGFAFNIGYCF